MRRHVFYLIGCPGSGKSTLLREALRDVPTVTSHSQPFGWIEYPNGAQIGRAASPERPVFSGTDALPMNVQPRVVDWLDRAVWANVVAEGDRLANASFFESVVHQGWQLTVALLDIAPDLAATRREARRTYQDPSWVRGRQTKVANLARHYVAPEWRLDARLPTEQLAARLCQHPAFVGLLG